MIETRDVSKHYGDFAALKDISIDIAPGEIVGLLGPNGAGKTTLLRTLTGFFEPSAGSITIDGHDVVTDPVAAQSSIGYLPEQTPLYPEMLVQEYLEMVADFRQLPPGDGRVRLLAEAVWSTGLETSLTRPIGALSKGFRQRVCLAQAILHKPKVLILDEPTSGLDPSQVVHVRGLIRELAKDATVLFSNHILSEVEQVCERVIVILGGRVRLDARLDEIRTARSTIVAIADETLDDTAAAKAAITALPGVEGAQSQSGRPGCATFEVHGDEEAEIGRAVFRLARDRGWELAELRPVARTLETVFRELVNDYEREAGNDIHVVGAQV